MEDELRVELMGPEMLPADSVQWQPGRGLVVVSANWFAECFAVSYTPFEEGIYTLSVMVGNCHAAHSPFACEVVVDDGESPSPSLSMCQAEWDVQPARCGEWAKMSISAPSGGVAFEMHVHSEHQSGPCTVLDKGNGRYIGMLRPLWPGEYSVSVLLGGEQISGSPFTEWVQPGLCNPRECVAVIATPNQLQELPKSFKVTPSSQFD